MFNRTLACVVACLLLIPTLALPFTVSADSIWSNAFLDDVRDETIELDRTMFVVDSTSGSLTGKESPGSKRDFNDADYSGAHKNGEGLSLNKVYKHDGKYWGIYDYLGHGGPSGWFPMNQLLVMYNRKDFNADVTNEFYNYTGNFDIKNVSDRLVTWQWPGSDSAKGIYNFAKGEDYYDGTDIKKIEVHFAYKDNQGREWGYIEIEAEINVSIGHGDLGRSLQTWDTWICFSDPSNESIPAFNPAPAPVKWSVYVSNHSDILSEDSNELLSVLLFYLPLIGSLFVLLAASAFVFIKVFRKSPDKDKGKSGGREKS